jgi:hypothetical protein
VILLKSNEGATMKTTIVILSAFLFAACQEVHEVDTLAPAAPRGVQTLSLDNAVEVTWFANTEPDLSGYNVWVSDRFDGRYRLLGSTGATRFADYGARNGVTYYYAVSAYDFDNNESPLSPDVAKGTPRPEGFGVILDDYHTFPNTSGYDFSTYSVGPFDDEYCDFFFEHYAGRFYLRVWDDTDIQGMGYTANLDEIANAPASGWVPSRVVEAIPGHTYVIWTWDNHYSKVRVRSVSANSVLFDWAYQTATGNRSLRVLPSDGKRKSLRPVTIGSGSE